jgi:hypothetical protein
LGILLEGDRVGSGKELGRWVPANDVDDRLAVIDDQRLEPEPGDDRLGIGVVAADIGDESLDLAGAVGQVEERPDPLDRMCRGLIRFRHRLFEGAGDRLHAVRVSQDDGALDLPARGLLGDRVREFVERGSVDPPRDCSDDVALAGGGWQIGGRVVELGPAVQGDHRARGGVGRQDRPERLEDSARHRDARDGRAAASDPVEINEVERLAGERDGVGLPEERLRVGEDLPAVSLDEVVRLVVDGLRDPLRPPLAAGARRLDPLRPQSLEGIHGSLLGLGDGDVHGEGRVGGDLSHGRHWAASAGLRRRPDRRARR